MSWYEKRTHQQAVTKASELLQHLYGLFWMQDLEGNSTRRFWRSYQLLSKVKWDFSKCDFCYENMSKDSNVPGLLLREVHCSKHAVVLNMKDFYTIPSKGLERLQIWALIISHRISLIRWIRFYRTSIPFSSWSLAIIPCLQLIQRK